MKTQQKSTVTAGQILPVMRILAWVGLVAFLIEAGALLFTYGVSFINPEAAQNLYKGLNLYELRRFNFWYYTSSVSLLASLALMKAWISFLVIKTLSGFNLQNPFTVQVASRLEQISHVAFGMWVLAMIHNGHLAWLMKLTGTLHGSAISGEFIFMVGLVFIISQVFKRGVEIQSENELTV